MDGPLTEMIFGLDSLKIDKKMDNGMIGKRSRDPSDLNGLKRMLEEMKKNFNRTKNVEVEISPVLPTNKSSHEHVMHNLDDLLKHLHQNLSDMNNNNMLDDDCFSGSMLSVYDNLPEQRSMSCSEKRTSIFEQFGVTSEELRTRNKSVGCRKEVKTKPVTCRNNNNHDRLILPLRPVNENQLHTIKRHSTLCRNLKMLEASYTINLKRKLDYITESRMKELKVSGCVHCMYSFYEKQKRDAAAKAHQVRRTREEQENIKTRLNQQLKQTEEDSEWLQQEDTKSYTSDPPKLNSQNGNSAASSNDSEQLGYDLYKEDFARDVLEKKMMKNSPLRRSIPWEFDRRISSLPNTTALPSPLLHETASDAESSASSDITRNDPPPPAALRPREPSPPTSRKASIDSPTDIDYAKPVKNLERQRSENMSLSTGLPSTASLASSSTSTSSFTLSTHPEGVASPEGVLERVYTHTTNVVKSVIELNTGVQHAQPEEFLDLVKVVGLNLRDLLSEVNHITYKEIELARKVLSSDMAELVKRMKTAQKYADTTVDQVNRKNMLAAAHALAIDTKNLYDTFSKLEGGVSSS